MKYDVLSNMRKIICSSSYFTYSILPVFDMNIDFYIIEKTVIYEIYLTILLFFFQVRTNRCPSSIASLSSLVKCRSMTKKIIVLNKVRSTSNSTKISENGIQNYRKLLTNALNISSLKNPKQPSLKNLHPINLLDIHSPLTTSHKHILLATLRRRTQHAPNEKKTAIAVHTLFHEADTAAAADDFIFRAIA